MALYPPKINCLNCRGLGNNLVFGKITKCEQCDGSGLKSIPMIYRKSVEAEQVRLENPQSTIPAIDCRAKTVEPEQKIVVDSVEVSSMLLVMRKKPMSRSDRMAKFKNQT